MPCSGGSEKKDIREVYVQCLGEPVNYEKELVENRISKNLMQYARKTFLEKGFSSN